MCIHLEFFHHPFQFVNFDVNFLPSNGPGSPKNSPSSSCLTEECHPPQLQFWKKNTSGFEKKGLAFPTPLQISDKYIQKMAHILKKSSFPNDHFVQYPVSMLNLQNFCVPNFKFFGETMKGSRFLSSYSERPNSQRNSWNRARLGAFFIMDI